MRDAFALVLEIQNSGTNLRHQKTLKIEKRSVAKTVPTGELVLENVFYVSLHNIPSPLCSTFLSE